MEHRSHQLLGGFKMFQPTKKLGSHDPQYGKDLWITTVNVYIAIENGPVEIVDLPSYIAW